MNARNLPARNAAAIARLNDLPTAGLGHWPTPLHRIERFSRAVGDTEIWIKRDDVQGVALAGNKIRKFDLVLGQALADGADTLVTTGAAQSNSARTCASAAAALGMKCILVLRGSEPETPTGNLVLDQLVGADVRFAGDKPWNELNAEVDAVAASVESAGGNVVAAPVGCSTPLGALGFAKAFLEFDQQLTDLDLNPSALVVTTTSGGTHAGLLVGRAISGRQLPIIAIDAGKLYADGVAATSSLAREAADLIGVNLVLDDDDVQISLGQLGDGYGKRTDAATEAITLLARTEAILTDPVYSGKGLAGLIELVRTAQPTGPIVFWHTGGYHSLFDPAHAALVLG